MKTLTAIFLALLLLVGPGLAAVGSWNGVAFTAWNGVAQTGWNGTTISCASGGSSVTAANRANSGVVGATPVNVGFTQSTSSPIVVVVLWQGTETITSVKWNTTETFTQLAAIGDGTTVDKLSSFILANPTSGTSTVDVVFSANPGGGAVVNVIGTTGGNTTTPNRTVYNRTELDGTGPTRTVADSVNGDLVIDAAVVFASTITWDAGETSTSTTTNNIAGSGFSGGATTKPAVGANTAVGATDVAFYAQTAFAVRP